MPRSDHGEQRPDPDLLLQQIKSQEARALRGKAIRN